MSVSIMVRLSPGGQWPLVSPLDARHCLLLNKNRRVLPQHDF